MLKIKIKREHEVENQYSDYQVQKALKKEKKIINKTHRQDISSSLVKLK